MNLLITDTNQRCLFILGLIVYLYHTQEHNPQKYAILQHMFQSDTKPAVDYLDQFFTDRPALLLQLYNRYTTSKSEVEIHQRASTLVEESKRYNKIKH